MPGPVLGPGNLQMNTIKILAFLEKTKQNKLRKGFETFQRVGVNILDWSARRGLLSQSVK